MKPIRMEEFKFFVNFLIYTVSCVATMYSLAMLREYIDSKINKNIR